MNRATTRRHDSVHATGFALVEVLVALSLLAVGVVTVLGAVLAALDLQRDADLRWRAGLILDDKLASACLDGRGPATARGVTPDGRFTWTMAAKPWPAGEVAGAPSTAPGLQEVTVEIRWETRRGMRRIAGSQLVGGGVPGEVAP